ncbi:macrolide phosphotransferase [Laceyella sacchari]|nr:macrolide phosphotransferase [Laceyella sacchari]
MRPGKMTTYKKRKGKTMTLSDKQVVEVARRHGLMVREDALTRNESGLDFSVVFAVDEQGEQWVLRLPRRPDVVPTARKEKAILDFLDGKIPVQTPQWTVFSDELIAYKRLAGVPAATIDPEAKAYVWEIDEHNVPDIFYETLGRAMAALHRTNPDQARQAGLTVHAAGELREAMRQRMEKVKVHFGVSQPLWDRWQKWLANDVLWPKQTELIHGDLHVGHILVDREARVTGIIDWTEARVDDPANDFVVHLSLFGEGGLQKLIDAYQKNGGVVWPTMVEHIIELQAAYPVAIAEFAMKSGLAEYETMAKQTLGVET